MERQPEPLTLELCLHYLQQLAREHPGPANKKERYDLFHGNGQPRCLVGRVLHRAGYRAKDTFITLPYTMNFGEGVVRVRAAGVVECELPMDDDVRVMLGQAQYLGDNGTPWKEVVDGLRKEWSNGS